MANLSELAPQDRDAIIRTVLGEAADQGQEGQAAVANVIRNRLSSGGFGATPQDVVYAPRQFEAWDNQRGPAWTAKGDSPQYQDAGKVVDAVWNGQYGDNTGGATHYYAPDLQHRLGRNDPSWASAYPQTAAIGGHVFYQDPRYSEKLGTHPLTSALLNQGQRRMDTTEQPQDQQYNPLVKALTGAFGGSPAAANSYPNEMQAKMGAALMGHAFEPTNAPGWGTTLGKLGLLIAGGHMMNDYNAGMQNYATAQDKRFSNLPSSTASSPLASASSTVQQPVAPARPNPSLNANTPKLVAPGSASPAIATDTKAIASPSANAGKYTEAPSIDLNTELSRLDTQFGPRFDYLRRASSFTNPDKAQRDAAEKELNSSISEYTAACSKLLTPRTEMRQVGDEEIPVVGTEALGWKETNGPRVNKNKIAAQGEAEKLKTKELHDWSKSIEAAGNNATTEMSDLDMAERLLRDPAFMSGPGSSIVGKLDAWAHQVNLTQGELSSRQQIFDKVTAGLSLQGIKDLASAGGVGPIRVAEMHLIDKANATRENNIDANLVLVAYKRAALARAKQFQVFKQQYEDADQGTPFKLSDGSTVIKSGQDGFLDHRFNRVARDWLNANPVLNKEQVDNFGNLLKGGKGETQTAQGGASPSGKNLAPEGYIRTAPDGTQEIKRGGKWVPHGQPQTAPSASTQPQVPAPQQTGSAAQPQQAAPKPIPQGASAAQVLSEGKATIARNPSARAEVEKILSEHGIDPAELGK